MDNWEKVELQDVCRIINGRAYKKSELLDEGKYRVLRVGNFFTNKQWYFSDLELDEDKYCDNGDLLYAWSASFGPRIWEGEKVIYHYHIWKMEPDEERVLKEYLHKFLLWDTEKIKSEQGVGTTMIHVTKGSMEERELPIPPLPVQKRIVTILDEAFEAINQAKANIERNIENAEELFQSKLNEIFSQRGEGWEEKPLGDLTYVKSGGTPRRSTKKYWENGSIPWYSSGELNELFTNESKDLITKKGLKKSNAKLFPKGSLLIGMYDTAALKMSILDRDGAFNQAISGAKPNEDLNLQFVMHAINVIKPELMKQRRGVRQKNLNLTKIKAIPIPFPKNEVQNEVVAYLGEFHDYTDTLIESYQNKLEDLNELKKSILQKAFSGELTANEHVAV